MLICDERGEIAYGNVGDFSDVYSFADKRTALMMGVRVMRPDVIITDELMEEDLPFLRRAKASGVKLISSYHAGRIEDVPIVFRDSFEFIILLDSVKIGKILEIYSSVEVNK